MSEKETGTAIAVLGILVCLMACLSGGRAEVHWFVDLTARIFLLYLGGKCFWRGWMRLDRALQQ